LEGELSRKATQATQATALLGTAPAADRRCIPTQTRPKMASTATVKRAVTAWTTPSCRSAASAGRAFAVAIPAPGRGRRLTGNSFSHYEKFCRLTRGRNDYSYERSPLTRGRNSGRPSGSPHVGSGGTRGQHPPAPLSGFMREQGPENRGAAVCVDCESNKEKVSQRLPHSGGLVGPRGSEGGNIGAYQAPGYRTLHV
jgi:hypothetical protein